MTLSNLLNLLLHLQHRDSYITLCVEFLGVSNEMCIEGNTAPCIGIQLALSIEQQVLILTINISRDDDIGAHHSRRKCVAKARC